MTPIPPRRKTYATSLIRTLRVFNEQYASRSGALSCRQLWNAAWSIAMHLDYYRSSSSSSSTSSIGRRPNSISVRSRDPGSRGATTTATTTTWDLRGEGITDLGASTSRGNIATTEVALMSIEDDTLDRIALRVIESLGGGDDTGHFLLRLLDVDVVYDHDDHDDAAGRTNDAPMGVRDRRSARSARSSAGMGGTAQDRAAVDSIVDIPAVVVFVARTSCE